jgi:hypothetical protein
MDQRRSPVVPASGFVMGELRSASDSFQLSVYNAQQPPQVFKTCEFCGRPVLTD